MSQELESQLGLGRLISRDSSLTMIDGEGCSGLYKAMRLGCLYSEPGIGGEETNETRLR